MKLELPINLTGITRHYLDGISSFDKFKIKLILPESLGAPEQRRIFSRLVNITLSEYGSIYRTILKINRNAFLSGLAFQKGNHLEYTYVIRRHYHADKHNRFGNLRFSVNMGDYIPEWDVVPKIIGVLDFDTTGNPQNITGIRRRHP
ncbi:hypothetical protein ACJU26_08850 [Acidithiobacillus sp. M4-SHS-6]|uniref:hypothetical protein n=1 Tax=Acidithiobacillus sp. M4-SHS-6 TaxID=3383024 RepID=UPI0039BE1175